MMLKTNVRPSALLLTLASFLVPACGDVLDSKGEIASDDGAADDNGGGGAQESGGDEGWGEGGTGAGPDEGGDDSGAEPEPDPDDEDSGTTGEADQCDAETPVALFLSPDDSNSMSSPVQVRDAVLGGWANLSGTAIRPWEFLNYYDFAYPPATPGTLVVTPSLAHDEGMAEGEYLLQIGVSSEQIAAVDRPPMNITFVLDTSGSMSGHPLEMLKATCRAIAASLQEGDVVSMVTWNTSNAIVLSKHAVTGPDDAELLTTINALSADGGTDLHSGLSAGYQLAQESFDSARINRVVLISDGGANVGVTDEKIIADHAGGAGEDGIYMVGVGVGTSETYNDLLLDAVTDAGKGASVLITSAEEADKIFRDRFVNTMAVAARDVQVKLELPPGFEIVSFSGEEYSTDPTEVEPQHISPNDAMVFHQRIETCAPELVTDETPITIRVRYKDATTFEEREVAHETSFSELLAADTALLRKGAAVFAYAEALKAHRDGEGASAIPAAIVELERAEASNPGDADLAEIRSVLEALQ